MAIRLRGLDLADLGAIQRLFADRCGLADAAVVAEETVFGAAPGRDGTDTLGAFEQAELVGLVAASGAWLRVLAVDPDARGRGVGTSLLAWAESGVAAGGHARCRTLAQPGNYLMPGVPEDDPETMAWLERRGYEAGARNTNLWIDLVGNPRVTPARARELAEACRDRGYRVERGQPGRGAELCAQVDRVFGPAWVFEVERALGGDPAGVHLAVASGSGEVAAFAAHDGNNRGLGWFGPAGTFEAHRGKGLGAALLLACLIDVAEAGRERGVIAWIGPRAFYQKVAGVAGERHYRVLAKDLAEDLEDETT